jgi:hypothetical protein
MRSLLGIADSQRATLSKEVATLVSANVLKASDGAYEVRRPARVRELLHVAAQLNAELAADAVRLAEQNAEAATTDERVLRKSRWHGTPQSKPNDWRPIRGRKRACAFA